MVALSNNRNTSNNTHNDTTNQQAMIAILTITTYTARHPAAGSRKTGVCERLGVRCDIHTVICIYIYI